MDNINIKVDVQGDPLEVSLLVKPGDSSRPSIVCLHGMQTSKSMYKELFSQPFMEDYSCMAIDFIGYGDSEKSEDFSYEIQSQMEVVAAVVERLGMGKYHIIGHSIGGMVGTLLAHDFPRQVLSFINLEGNLILEDCGKSREIVETMYDDFSTQYLPQLKTALKNDKEPSSDARLEALDQATPLALYETSYSVIEWCTSQKLKQHFNQLRCPKIFVCGDKLEAKIKSIEDESLVRMIPDSGHFMFADNPKMFHKVVKQFLEDLA